jgi:hypothetical protein
VLELEPLGLSGTHLTRLVARDRSRVFAVLHADPRFVQVSGGRASRWRLSAQMPLEGLSRRHKTEDRPGLTVRITLADQREYMRRGTP